MTEVPGYIRHENHTQNAVQVQGGTNWDLSRSAVTTPIAPAVDPVPQRGASDCACDLGAVRAATAYLPQHRMPDYAPDVTVRFSRNAVLLSGSAQRDLRTVSRQSRVIVAGHADTREKNAGTLAQKRADAVARELKKRGVKVESVKAFGATLPLTDAASRADVNRRVEVFSR